MLCMHDLEGRNVCEFKIVLGQLLQNLPTVVDKSVVEKVIFNETEVLRRYWGRKIMKFGIDIGHVYK